MQRVNNLFEKLISFDNLYLAYKKAKKGTKTYEAQEFSFNLENELIKLQIELEQEKYEPDNYKYFIIKEPKEREISVASFRDRVVHHAIVNILEPIYEKSFIYDSYATRKNKGTYKAIKQAQEYIKKNKYYFKSDISKYFENINHNILIEIIKRKIKDKNLINLLIKIINKGGNGILGIPIGNLTSQFFANVYLDKFDHFIKEELRIEYYIRYMDDFVIFSNEIKQIKQIKILCHDFLKEKLQLSLKEKATYINKNSHGLSFLGTRIFKNIIRIKNENLRRYLRKIKRRQIDLEKNLITEEQYNSCINSIYNGLIAKFNTLSLRRSIIIKGNC